jgi:hypothetical protein
MQTWSCSRHRDERPIEPWLAVDAEDIHALVDDTRG